MSQAYRSAVALAVAAILAAPLIAGSDAALLGTWEASAMPGVVLVLSADGSGSLAGEPFRWRARPGVLELSMDEEVVEYQTTLAGDSLTLAGGDMPQPMAFRRAGGVSPVGTWELRGGQGSFRMVLNKDGTGSSNGVAMRWSYAAPQLTITSSSGSEVFHTTITAATLSLQGATLPQGATLQRTTDTAGGVVGAIGRPGAGGGVIAQELVGKWCYFSSMTATAGGGRMSEECFVLHPDGTYVYGAESSASAYAPGVSGGTASQSSDSGTWRLEGSTIVAQSRTQGKQIYPLEKRNNQNDDPMLCLGGRCFVTYGQRAPWR